LREVRRSGSHVVRLLLCRDFCSGQRLIEIIAPSTRRVTQCGALDQLDIGSAQERISRLREAIADRRRYLEILA